jgi:hypothetical protein
MARVIDGAMQQAAQPLRQFMPGFCGLRPAGDAPQRPAYNVALLKK